MKKPLVLILSVFMALLLCGCTNYCYEDTVSNMDIMYGSYFMLMSEYNPDGAAVSCYAWDGDTDYSKDGRLYYRKDDALVGGFNYVP